ncbi:MAG: peptidase domain-containing ABC transporter, partial [Waterburya sp.]
TNQEPEASEVKGQLLVLESFSGSVIFDSVSFRYEPDEKNTIFNLSFEIKPGQTVALVGRSGSGKTTISKLLLGLYQPQSGQILIDSQSISNISLRSLREKIGIVDQDTFLFGSTIKENLLIASPTATQEDLEAACQLACADFIEKLPLKYETKIGEGGGLLSGGQRQRLAIARALLRNPSLLILDEATSNLDTESEKIIQTNLNNILRERTTLVIAHRLSTVRHADLILVLDQGVLIERGNHEELMARRGQYYHLASQQLGVG